MRMHLTEHPLAFQVYRLTRNRRIMVSNKTDILIDGFPRSANTFVVVSFERINSAARIAHHMHAPCEVRKAVKLNKPVIILIREPIDAIRSMCIRHPYVSPRAAALAYYRFYKAVLSVIENVVVCRFECATTDVGAVFDQANKKWSTAFNCSTQGRDEIFLQIDSINAQQENGNISMLSRPTEERLALKRIVPIDEKSKEMLAAIRVFDEVVRRCKEVDK